MAFQLQRFEMEVRGVYAPPPIPRLLPLRTRHARCIEVRGLPSTANPEAVEKFFNDVMFVIGGVTDGLGRVVCGVQLFRVKKFAIVEMRCVQEATNAMQLDGILFEGVPVRVLRPPGYDPQAVAYLRESQPFLLVLGAVGLPRGSPWGLQGTNRILVGGLPELPILAIKGLLERELFTVLGRPCAFHVIERHSDGTGYYYATCVFEDRSFPGPACVALDARLVGPYVLSARPA
ncbi:hypothetical protein Vadar_018472 [Vaccinium darrowii]|uniref:Uncharacterized protein n=1 Tax=Vaccinium darrowii TaxID=229202 RepID=A0ACB7YEX4_9ERIC|nr:hypothetical protein Vadar_018472 [Vaccinium darrowii]